MGMLRGVTWRARGARMVVAVVAATGAGAGALVLPSAATAATARRATVPPALQIGVDHLDPANQQPQNGRFFEYQDFFASYFEVVQGQSVTFNNVGFHSIAFAASIPAGQASYPTFTADADELAANGGPHIAAGAGFFPTQGGDVTHPGQGTEFGAGGPSCGLSGQPVCTFTGGNDFESSGPFGGQSWTMQINAAPGHYFMYCTIHPRMSGDFVVVQPGQPPSEQGDLNSIGQAQFVHERADAIAAEQNANHIQVNGTPGHRTFTMRVGIGADRVSINEMLPNKPLNLVAGDQVRYLWPDGHNIHSVKFPADGASDPPPFGLDCAGGYPGVPPCTEPGEGTELILDPGTTASGQPLATTTAVVDSGLITGKGYGIPGEPSKWSVTTNTSTASGTYTFHCTLHGYMTGQLILP
jgi:plastocyanin